MQVLSFPGCCTAKVLAGFGQSNTAQYGIRPRHEQTDQQMKADIDRSLRSYSAGTSNGLVVAMITSSQKQADRVLTSMGFSDTGWQQKDAHPETKLKMFWVNPREYVASALAERQIAAAAAEEAKRLERNRRRRELYAQRKIQNLA